MTLNYYQTDMTGNYVGYYQTDMSEIDFKTKAKIEKSKIDYKSKTNYKHDCILQSVPKFKND